MGYVPPTKILTNSSWEAIAQTGGPRFLISYESPSQLVTGGCSRSTHRLMVDLATPIGLRRSFVTCYSYARIMPQPASAPIEEGVIQVLRNVSRRPIDPTLASDLVA